jgi:hypothetical protein
MLRRTDDVEKWRWAGVVAIHHYDGAFRAGGVDACGWAAANN